MLYRIHSLCPQIHATTFKRKDVPTEGMFSRTRVSSSHPLLIGKINERILTRLELEGLPSTWGVFLTPDIKLPVLQELVLKGFRHYSCHPGHTFQLPTMPTLQRLCFRDCIILDIRSPLPRNCSNLRVLEVEGGMFCVNNIWESLGQLMSHCRLELLTMAPQHLSPWPVNGNMTSLVSLTHLRISFCGCCTGSYEMVLPAKIEHLVVEHPCHRMFDSSLPKLETVVEAVLEKKADGCAYPCLQTLTIHTKTHRSFQWDRVGLRQKAARAGVKLEIHYHGALNHIHPTHISCVIHSERLIYRL